MYRTSSDGTRLDIHFDEIVTSWRLDHFDNNLTSVRLSAQKTLTA